MFKDPNFKVQYTIIYGVVTIVKNIFLCTAVIINAANTVKEDKESNIPSDIDLGSFNPTVNHTNH